MRKGRGRVWNVVYLRAYKTYNMKIQIYILVIFFILKINYCISDTSQKQMNVPELSNTLRFQSYKEINDSLLKELLHYRMKEDYYATALNDQANRFYAMITFLLAIAGLFSYLGFRLERKKIVDKVKQQTDDLNNSVKILMNKEKEEFNEFKKYIQNLELTLHLNAANLNISIAMDLEEKNNLHEAVRFNILGCKYNLKCTLNRIQLNHNQGVIDNGIEIAIKNLQAATTLFDIIMKDGNLKQTIIGMEEGLYKDLDEIMTLNQKLIPNNKKLTVLWAEIRLNISEYIK